MNENIEDIFIKRMADVRKLLKDNNITIDEFCDLAGVGRSFFFRYGNDKTQKVPESISVITKVENAYLALKKNLEDE